MIQTASTTEPLPNDLIPTRKAAMIAQFDTAWGFVRWARQLGLTEHRRKGSNRSFWSRSEIATCGFSVKTSAS